MDDSPAGDDAEAVTSPAPPDRQGEMLDALARVEKLAAAGASDVAAALDRLEQRVAERDRLADRDRDLVDRLHAENQRLKAGEAFAVIAPIARDLVRLRDQVRQLDESSPKPGTGDAALIEPQLTQILERIGVQPFEPAAGDRFDPAWHQGAGRRATADAALDGKVAGVRRPGFAGPDGRPLRPAEVDVWRHDPKLEPTAGAGTAERDTASATGDPYAAGDTPQPTRGD
jgi:molecular chaperone GrpE (heat shock protein)